MRRSLLPLIVIEITAIFGRFGFLPLSVSLEHGDATQLFFLGMTKPGQRQKTSHAVRNPISPDDVLALLRAREQRLKSDLRTDLEKHFGDPEPSRSALAEYQARQAAGSQPASRDSVAAPSTPRATPSRN